MVLPVLRTETKLRKSEVTLTHVSPHIMLAKQTSILHSSPDNHKKYLFLIFFSSSWKNTGRLRTQLRVFQYFFPPQKGLELS